MKLWLDDIRPAPNGWTWCKNVGELMPQLESLKTGGCGVTHISLDNDLGPCEPEGCTVLDALEQWQAENPTIFIPEIDIHSANPVAVVRMTKVARRLMEKMKEIRNANEQEGVMKKNAIPTTEDFQAPSYIKGWRCETAEYVISKLSGDKREAVEQHVNNGFQLMVLCQQGGWSVSGLERFADFDNLYSEWRTYRQTDNFFVALLARSTGERCEIATKDGGGYIHRRKDAAVYETLSGIRFGVLFIPGDARHYTQTVIVPV